MRLASFRIENYKGVTSVEIKMPREDDQRPGSADFLSIVGPNNLGKSSILEALMLGLENERKADKDLFREHKPEMFPIEITLEFDELTERDRNLRAVSRHIHDNKYRIKKIWRHANTKPERFVITQDYEYIGLPDEPIGREDIYKLPGWAEVIAKYEAQGKRYSKGAAPFSKLKDIARTGNFPVAKPLAERKSLPDDSRDEDWHTDEELKNPGGLASNLATALPRVIYVPALKETEEEANTSKKNSAIRQIVQELFERRFEREAVMQRLRRAVSDMTELFRDGRKNPLVVNIEDRISRKLKQLIDVQAQLFLRPDLLKELYSHLTSGTEFKLQDPRSKVATWPKHQGHGAQRALILCLLQVLADELANESSLDVLAGKRRPLVLLIEEPEIYLHPEMCRKMRDTLLQISKQKRAQVICTTHSPVFLDLADRHDGIVLLRTDEEEKFCYLQKTDDLFGAASEDRQRLRMLLNFDPAVKEVFFAKRVCLVEGDTEIAAVEAIANKLIATEMIGRDPYLLARRDVLMVNCRGKWTIPAFQQVLHAFGKEYVVIHDSDIDTADEELTNDADGNSANARIEEFLASTEHRFVNRPNFERDVLANLSNKSSIKDKPWRATQAINSATAIPARAIEFFEFVLGCQIADLVVKEDEIREHRSSTNSTPRRNHRNSVQHIQLFSHTQTPEQTVEAAFGIAAGPGRLDELEPVVAVYKDAKGRDIYVARVVGDSMADTLLNGDMLAIQKIDFSLSPVTDERTAMPLEHFVRQVKNNGVYIVAINQGIDDKQYTIKRVELFELKNGGWGCKLVADNPEADWGDRGRVFIKKTDRVHFAAEVKGFALVADRVALSKQDSSLADSA